MPHISSRVVVVCLCASVCIHGGGVGHELTEATKSWQPAFKASACQLLPSTVEGSTSALRRARSKPPPPPAVVMSVSSYAPRNGTGLPVLCQTAVSGWLRVQNENGRHACDCRCSAWECGEAAGAEEDEKGRDGVWECRSGSGTRL